jgi:hypothetical protein
VKIDDGDAEKLGRHYLIWWIPARSTAAWWSRHWRGRAVDGVPCAGLPPLAVC